MIIPFKYYLHDSYSGSEFAGYIEDATGFRVSEELMQEIGKPFYEVAFNCTLDTETGEVKFQLAEGQGA